MSTLSNTTWTINLASTGSVTFTFNENGTASAGGSIVWYWTESPDGSWMVQTLNPSLQNNVSMVYFGKHSGGQGNGYFTNGWQGALALLQPFTMNKN